MEYKVNYKEYEFIVTQNEDGSFNIPEDVRDLEPFGTALKPASEYIVVARKPLSEKSVAKNVLKWGTGGINIDGCRIEGAYGSGQNEVIEGKESGVMYHNYDGDTKPATGHKNKIMVSNPEGRFPANIILECICDEVIKREKGEIIENGGSGGIWNEGTKEPVGRTYNDKGDIHTNPMCPCYMMDEQSGVSKTTADLNYKYDNTDCDGNTFQSRGKYTPRSDKGGSSRFFYQAKVSKAERNMGLDGFEEKENNSIGSTYAGNQTTSKIGGNPDKPTEPKKNTHPTVKPVNLMAYLCRLVTPPNGIVLDPYMGSGATGIAAQLEGFRFVGMELDEDYFKIAEARINNYEKYKKFKK